MPVNTLNASTHTHTHTLNVSIHTLNASIHTECQYTHTECIFTLAVHIYIYTFPNIEGVESNAVLGAGFPKPPSALLAKHISISQPLTSH